MKHKLLIATATALLLALQTTSCNHAAGNERESQAITSEVIVQSSICWNNDSLPIYNEGIPQVTVLKITIPPHMQLGIHKHPMLNTAVVTQGQLTVNDDAGNRRTFSEGEAIVECVNRWHYGMNEGDKEVILYVFYAGTTELPLSIAQ